MLIKAYDELEKVENELNDETQYLFKIVPVKDEYDNLIEAISYVQTLVKNAKDYVVKDDYILTHVPESDFIPYINLYENRSGLDSDLPENLQMCAESIRHIGELARYYYDHNKDLLDRDFIDSYVLPLFADAAKRAENISNYIKTNLLDKNTETIISNANDLLDNITDYNQDFHFGKNCDKGRIL